MVEKYYGQFTLFMLFVIVIGLITPYLPGLSYIHELGHYLTAKSAGYNAYIKDAFTTIVDCSKPSVSMLMSGYYSTITVYAILAVILICACSYRNFAASGVFYGLFIGDFICTSIKGIIPNKDFIQVSALYSIDPYAPYSFYGMVLSFILCGLAMVKMLSIKNKVYESSRQADNNPSLRVRHER